jgi:hypothetical protein
MLSHVTFVGTYVSEKLSSSETLVLTRGTPRNIAEDGILQSNILIENFSDLTGSRACHLPTCSQGATEGPTF